MRRRILNSQQREDQTLSSREVIARKAAAAKKRALHAPKSHFLRDLHEAACSHFSGMPLPERIARSTAHAIICQDVLIEPDDNLIGRIYHLSELDPEQSDPEFDVLSGPFRTLTEKFPYYAQLVENQLVTGVSFGHITWFWHRILSRGVTGLYEDFSSALCQAQDQQAIDFYKGVLIMLEALLAWNEKHVSLLEAQGQTEMAAICRQVPRYPARTFHEAIQSFFMSYIVVMRENPYGGNGPGRLDYYLWPYLEQDLKQGRCSLELARELIDELFLRIDERIHMADGWVEAVVVGGSHSDGKSAINPLSRMMIESIMDLNITHPSIYVRLPEKPDADFMALSARYILSGSNRAQILSDTAIIRALAKSKVPFQDAVEYACGGCMEIGIQGMTSDFLFSGWFNVAKIAELFTTGGICLKTKKKIEAFQSDGLVSYTSFDAFYTDFIKEMRRLINISHEALDLYSEASEKARPAYLLSSMIDDCLSRGRNMHGGGARYHDYGTSPVGMPNAADYLYAIEQAVFIRRLCTAEELVKALTSNFQGCERLQARLKSIPKYGREDEGADGMAHRLMNDIGSIYAEHKNRWGGRCKVVVLTFVWAPVAGDLMGATADGSRAGKPLAHGVTPQSSAMTQGITAAMNSYLTMPLDLFSGGAATMWDFDAEWVTQPLLEAVLKTFIAQGGQIFQGNTTDVSQLIDAQKNPDEYPHLIVRVGGYSARFVHLDQSLQNEIINRTRHCG